MQKFNCFVGGICLLVASTASAKVLYVDGNANANSSDCTRSLPCTDFIDAISNLRKGDTIRIAPGYYSSDIGWTIPFDNVKIESIQGPRVTELASESASVLTITGNNVRIGRKGKGIGLQSYFEDRDANVHLLRVENVKKVTIEGNAFSGNDFDRDGISGEYDETEAAIDLTNVLNVSIRSNYFNWVNYGIQMTNVTEKARVTIQNNEFDRIAGDCVAVNLPGKSRLTIKQNRFGRCRQDNDSRTGDIHGAMVVMPEGTLSIADNAFRNGPIGIAIEAAKPTIQRNSFLVGREAIEVDGALSGKIKDNTIRYYGFGVATQNSSKLVMTGNHVWADVPIFHRDSQSSYKSISGNMFGDRQSTGSDSCPIIMNAVDPAFPLTFKKNGWTANAVFGDDQYPGPDMDVDDCVINGTTIQFATGGLIFDSPKENVTTRLKDKVPF